MKRHLVKKIGLFAVVLALAAATGCSSVAVANKFNGMMPAPNNEVKPVAHLN